MPLNADRFLEALQAWWRGFNRPADDPRVAYPDAHERQLALLDRVRRAVAGVSGSRALLAEKTAELTGPLDGLEQQARQALRAGREDVARLALRRREAARVELVALEAQLAELTREEMRLRLVEERLRARVAEIAAREQVLAARSTAAEAQVRLGEALAGLSGELSDLTDELLRTEERAEALEARAAALDRIVGLGGADLVERELADAGAVEAVDQQLARIRRELGREALGSTCTSDAIRME